MVSKRRAALNGIELKRSYQKNMLISFFSAGLVFIAGFAVAASLNEENNSKNGSTKGRTGCPIPPPPPPQHRDLPRWIDTKPKQSPPELGEIIPVPDDEVPDDSLITIFDEIINWVPDQPEFDPVEYASAGNIERILIHLLPPPGAFIAYDEQPVQIRNVLPAYPPMAQSAGIEGAVWVKALIDKEGNVRDVIIVKESGANAGFEEAAIEAARKTVWKPAIANGQSVALWVTYKVEFKLQ